MILFTKREKRESEKLFDRIYEKYHQRIFSLAFSITESKIMAQEIAQEVFIKIWDKIDELSEVRNLEAWITTIVKNQCYTSFAKLSKERRIVESLATEQGRDNRNCEESLMADSEIISKEQLRLYKMVLESLPAQQKKIFILSRQEGSTYEEIALATNLSVNTVKSHMKAAIRSVNQKLEIVKLKNQ